MNERTMPERTEVAIVGAGPAGLAVAACLSRAGIPFIILERGAAVGASWRRHYERLHLHTVKQLSALPYLPFAAHEPRYVSRDGVIAYLERYAREFGLAPRFAEAVRAVRHDQNGWLVESTGLAIHARHVVIASGMNAEPVVPEIPGLARFGGRVIQSGGYTNAKPFARQSVLVIGMGNTGAEIALDLAEAGARPSVSLRNGVHIAPRDLFGIPIQRIALATAPWLPRALLDSVFPPILDAALGWPRRYGLRRPARGLLEQIATAGKIPVLDVGTVREIAEGRIAIEPGIETLTDDGALFVGGRAARFDAIVLASGYRANYRGFLDAGVPGPDAPEGRERADNLHFVGFRNTVTGLLRAISHEAIAVAAKIAATRAVPS